MAVAEYVSVEMRMLSCGECGVTFSAPEAMMAERQRKGGNWYCPNGHSRIYAETTEAKLRKQLAETQERERQERERRFAEERKHEATQKKLKRMTKRATAGVCQLCNRSFHNVTRHMKSQHPGAVIDECGKQERKLPE